MRMHGFGYDMVSDNYKVVAVFDVDDNNCTFSNEVEVHTLGTNSWKSIPAFPYGVSSVQQSGQCVSGAINWLVYNDVRKSRCFIVSLDLRNESYEEVLMPDYDEGDRTTLQLSVFRYSLCFISGEDVWIMKEYGNKESWTKLFTISLMGGPPRPSYSCVHTIHIFENDQVLLEYLEGYRSS
ncbi:F-box protein, partial [Trifolium medium]|nr:F-box protein [Trifolium medium]